MVLNCRRHLMNGDLILTLDWGWQTLDTRVSMKSAGRVASLRNLAAGHGALFSDVF